MSGLFRKVSRRAKITGLCGWAERIRTGEWRTRVEPRSFRRRDRDRNVTETPFCAPPVPGTVSDTAHLMSESADRCARRSAPPSRPKTSHSQLLMGFNPQYIRGADTKKCAGANAFAGCFAPVPGGCLRRTRRPIPIRLDRKGLPSRHVPCCVSRKADQQQLKQSPHADLSPLSGAWRERPETRLEPPQLMHCGGLSQHRSRIGCAPRTRRRI